MFGVIDGAGITFVDRGALEDLRSLTICHVHYDLKWYASFMSGVLGDSRPHASVLQGCYCKLENVAARLR